MTKQLPSLERLKSLFQYEPKRGQLVWRLRADKPAHWNTRYAGKDAGTRRPDGYVVVSIDGVKFYLHRLIWKMDTGREPSPLLDHRDGNRSDNRKTNLREATVTQNMMNQRAWGSLPKGVYFHRKSKTFAARITVNGKCIGLGYFNSAEGAGQAYAAAAIEYFGEFSRTSERAA